MQCEIHVKECGVCPEFVIIYLCLNLKSKSTHVKIQAGTVEKNLPTLSPPAGTGVPEHQAQSKVTTEGS